LQKVVDDLKQAQLKFQFPSGN